MAEALILPVPLCDVGEDSSVLSCNSDVQAQSGTWQVFLPAPTPPLTCEDYGEVTFEFLFDGAEDCGGNSTTTYVASGDCTPAQDVPIEFFHWSVRDNDGTGTEHSFIVPVVESGGDFTARAWLREITVSDFNDADELYIVPRGERVQFTSGDTIDGSNLLKLDANNTSDTYSVGEVEMGAAFLVDGVPRGPGPFILPEVTVDWSCQYNPFNPHFTVIPNLPQAYAARLGDLGLYGVDQDHRIILRNFPSVDLATVELEGRSERFLIPMTESQGVYYFDRTTESHGVIDIAGSATLVGDDVVVSLSTFKLSETNLGTRVFTFEPLDE